MMNKTWNKLCMGMSLLSVVFLGCDTQVDEMRTRQADIGFGIVEGTKGYQEFQRERTLLQVLGSEIKGQVVRIEGAAYVVQMLSDHQVRLPFDEGTKIDRPAHVGDWIQAYVNQDGRTQFIQNIDDQIVLE